MLLLHGWILHLVEKTRTHSIPEVFFRVAEQSAYSRIAPVKGCSWSSFLQWCIFTTSLFATAADTWQNQSPPFAVYSTHFLPTSVSSMLALSLSCLMPSSSAPQTYPVFYLISLVLALLLPLSADLLRLLYWEGRKKDNYDTVETAFCFFSSKFPLANSAGNKFFLWSVLWEMHCMS